MKNFLQIVPTMLRKKHCDWLHGAESLWEADILSAGQDTPFT